MGCEVSERVTSSGRLSMRTHHRGWPAPWFRRLLPVTAAPPSSAEFIPGSPELTGDSSSDSLHWLQRQPAAANSNGRTSAGRTPRAACAGGGGGPACDVFLPLTPPPRPILRPEHTMRTKCAISDAFVRDCVFAYCRSVAQHVYSLSAEQFLDYAKTQSRPNASEIAHLIRIV